MTDIDRAKRALEKGHTLVLCKGGEVLTSDLSGIAPMLAFIGEGKDLRGWSAADAIVGKAAALLFVYAGIAEAYAKVLSEEGEKVLKTHGVPYTCGEKTRHIINRRGDGICPMEKAVLNVSDSAEALVVLRRTHAALCGKA